MFLNYLPKASNLFRVFLSRIIEMTPKSIIISGTSGVGKTSVAKLLAARLNIRYLSFSSFVIGRGLYLRYDSKRDTFEIDFNKSRKALLELISQDSYVIESVIPDIIPKSYAKLVVILRFDPLILARRLIKRGWKLGKILENVEAELLGVCLQEAMDYYGMRLVHEIDMTGRKTEEVVNEIQDLLKRNVKVTKVGVIDWLSKYDNPLKLREVIIREYKDLH